MKDREFYEYAEMCRKFLNEELELSRGTAGDDALNRVSDLSTAMAITGLSSMGNVLAQINNTDELPPAMTCIAMVHAVMQKPITELVDGDVLHVLHALQYQLKEELKQWEDEE